MRCKKEMMRLYAVTDRTWVGDRTLLEQVEEALKGGVTCVQIREKNMSEEDFLQEAAKMKVLCDSYKVPLIINDNVQIAKQIHASGVHVGQGDMEVSKVRDLVGESMIIGVSARTVEQALAAKAGGADYLGVGAVFGTSTKNDAKTINTTILADICKAVDIPVVAIGGVNKKNISELKGTGVDGAAVVSAIFATKDIEAECRELRALSDDMVQAE